MKRYVVSAALMGALLAGTALRAEAGLPELFETQIQKSRERAEAISGFESPPVKAGSFISRRIRLQGREEAWASHQAFYENAREEVILQKSKTVPDWDGVEKMAGSTWRLWLAENRLRWIFLRECAFGTLVIVLPVSVAVWPGLRQWGNRKGEEALPSSSRLAVTPDHPLDFRVRLSDPKETRLKIGPGAEDYDLQGNGWRTNGNHGAPFPGKIRRWPRTFGITGLIASHLAFFLPLRAFIPVAPELDPWWGIGLVIADEILLVMVIRAGIKKRMRTRIQKEGLDVKN